MNIIQQEMKNYEEDMIKFLQKLIQIESYTGKETEIIECIKKEMEKLGYDQILESTLGDIIGVIGNGSKEILFDSHVDVVEVKDKEKWKYPPFSGHIEDGIIYGRGTVDMKSAIASTVYAGFLAKKLGLTEGKKIYVSTSVMEEDFDAYALGKLMDEFNLKPDVVVICEPSSNRIALGHRGRAMIEVFTNGVSAHGSAPENGKNAVYEMNKVISRIEELNKKLYEEKGEHGSVVLSKIECTTVSLNAVPEGCKIYLDRRLALGENYTKIEKEMNKILEGIDGSWNVQIGKGMSRTNREVSMYAFLEAWEVKKEALISKKLAEAYEEQIEKSPEFFKWNFSTNGFASTGRGIPTIGIGPGDLNFAHMRDEQCKISDVIDACKIYTSYIEKI